MDSGILILVGIALIVVGVFVAAIVYSLAVDRTATRNRQQAQDAITRDRQEVANAAAHYQALLAQLQRDPTNALLYQHTLEAGRHYSNLTRHKQGVTIFDELALGNDLNAARAGAVLTVQPAPPQSAATRIRDIDELRQQGLITEQEYTAKRAEILRHV